MPKDELARQMFGVDYDDLSIAQQIQVDDRADEAEDASKGSGLWNTQDLIDKGAQVRGVDLVLNAGGGYEQRFYRNANNPDLWTPAAPTRIPAGSPGSTSSGGGSTGSTSTGPRVPVGLITEQEIIDAGGKKVAPGRYEVPLGDGRIVGYYQDSYNPGLYSGTAPVRPAGSTSTSTVALPTRSVGSTVYDESKYGVPGEGGTATRKVSVENVIAHVLSEHGIVPQGNESDLLQAFAIAQSDVRSNIDIITSFGRKPPTSGDPLDIAAAAAVLKNDAWTMAQSGLAPSYTAAVEMMRRIDPETGKQKPFGVTEQQATKYSWRPSAGTRGYMDYLADDEKRTKDYLDEMGNPYGEYTAKTDVERENALASAMELERRGPVGNHEFATFAKGGTIITDDPLAIVNMHTGKAIGVTSEYGQPEKTIWGDGKIVIDPMTRGFANGGTIADIDAQIASLRRQLTEDDLGSFGKRKIQDQITALEAQKAAMQTPTETPGDTLPGTPETPTTPVEEPAYNPFAAMAGTSWDVAESAYLTQQRRKDYATDYHRTEYAGLQPLETITLPFSALGMGGGSDGMSGALTVSQREVFDAMPRDARESYLRSLGFSGLNAVRDILYGDDLKEGYSGLARPSYKGSPNYQEGGAPVSDGFVNIADLPKIPGVRYEYPNIGAEISALQQRLLTMPVDPYTAKDRAAINASISKLREAQVKAYPWINRPPPLNQPTLAEDPIALVAGVGKKGKK